MKQIYLTFYELEPNWASNRCILPEWYYNQEYHKYIYENSSIIYLYHFELADGNKVEIKSKWNQATVLTKPLYRDEKRWENPKIPESSIDFLKIECNMIRNNGTEITELDFCNHAMSTIDDIQIKDVASKEKYIDMVKSKLELFKTPKKKKSYTDHEKKPWFKVGMLFYTGDIDKLLLEHGSARQVAIALGNENLKGYITDSTANKDSSKKSIFKANWKLKILDDFAKDKGIKGTLDFVSKIPLN